MLVDSPSRLKIVERLLFFFGSAAWVFAYGTLDH
jgi:hypothetical protein